MSLRIRLTLWNVFVLASSLVLLGLALHYIVSGDLMRQIDGDLLDEVRRYERITQALHEGRTSSEADLNEALGKLHVALKNLDDKSAADYSPFVVRGFSPSGHSVLADPTKPRPNFKPYDEDSLRAALKGEPDFRDVAVVGKPFRLLSYPVMRGGTPLVVLQSVKPLSSLQSTVSHLDSVLIHLAPLAVLFAVLGGAFLTGRSLKPIGAMASAAESITAENLSARLPVAGRDELGRLSAVFNRMLARLEDSFEAQQRFVADASHELRTPLTALKANTSLALSSGFSVDDMRLALASADKSADRMTRLVNDLLFLSRADAGELAPRLSRVVVADVVESVFDLFRTQAADAGVKLRAEIPAGSSVMSDEDYLQRLLVNLVSNALVHTPAGGRVSVSACDGELVVSDTGCGIAAEHLPRLFDRFYRVDEARSPGGTGLGLAICRSMAEAMGWTIEVESQIGSGSRFRVRMNDSAAGD